ncbi:hypothetical protein K5549_020804, partial [Capra hircus]
MTLFHFRNCFALAVACGVQAGVTYLFVQLCKVLFLATFFPTREGSLCDFIGDLVHYIVTSAQVWMITRSVLLLMFLSVKTFVVETFVHLLFPGQLDGTAGSSAGDGAFGPQHLRPVYCQRARL